jgi:glycosyltransferase involved in cell wall biosynthesis
VPTATSIDDSRRDPGPLTGLTVAHFGHFDPSYARNRIVAKALRRAGATVISARDPRPFLHRTPRIARGLVRSRADAVIVGFPGHADVAMARAIGRRLRAPVLFDAFLSRYETAVEDRGLVAPRTLQARRCALEDRFACALSTRVLLDTETHMDYFADRFGVPRSKLRRLWVGADDDVMRPGPPPDDARFRVFVYASFIPLHGLEHVVRAAKVLERHGDHFRVEIVGGGQTEASVRQLAGELGVANVRFLGSRPYAELPRLMASSHVCLGIFGTTPKAARVIPNKVFDALAVARPVISADTPAIRELLVDREHALLCPAGQPEALAHAITELAGDERLRQAIAARGHARFRECLSIEALSRDLGALVLDEIDR